MNYDAVEIFPRHGMKPHRQYLCPDCMLPFVARSKYVDGRIGKQCPRGHWNPIHVLNRYTDTGVKTSQRGATPKRPIEPAQHFTVGELKQALKAMLDSYEHVISVLPKHSAAMALIHGGFGPSPALARKILEGSS